MSDSPYIFEITAENYEQIVLQGSHQVPILVDFWADWCQPCKILIPILERVAEAYQGRFVLAKINTEEQQAIAAQFGLRSIPTVKLFKEGREVDEFSGAIPESDLRAFLDKHLDPAGGDNNVIAAAQQLMLAGDAAGALELLGPAQAADPGNGQILITMAQAQAAVGNLEAANFALDALPEHEQNSPEVKILRGQMHFDQQAPDASEIDTLTERLAKDENDSEARLKLASHLITQHAFSDAIDHLLKLMQKDPGYGENAAKETLLKLFDMLEGDPLATQGRRRMFTLLH